MAIPADLIPRLRKFYGLRDSENSDPGVVVLCLEAEAMIPLVQSAIQRVMATERAHAANIEWRTERAKQGQIVLPADPLPDWLSELFDRANAAVRAENKAVAAYLSAAPTS